MGSRSKVTRYLLATISTDMSQESLSGIIELNEDDAAIVEKMLCFFYTCEYSDLGENAADAVINILVYAIADKYNIETLKRLAITKFKGTMSSTKFNPNAFPGIVRQIYSTTPSSDRGLRDCAKDITKQQKDSLRLNKAFRNLLQDGILEGDFVLDVLDAWVN